ncbi:MAG: RNB domain-containing ribonuclease [Elusimicrobia bacterium]|nr:RNB domain-containing ribonuclease [Elusimicrobiota bacterium]
MTNADSAFLAEIAERSMTEDGFIPHPPPQALAEAQASSPTADAAGARDLSALPWTSIDNPESRDLDQIEAAEASDGGIKLYVGIADVEHRVPFGGANDLFAGHNAVTVYTGVRTFPMLPERFSFDLTSLVAGQKRLTVVIETLVAPDGRVKSGAVYTAMTVNKAKLDYPSVSAWLDGKAPPPRGLADNPALQKQIQLQDVLAKSLVASRKRLGALDIDTKEVQVVTDAQGAATALTAHAQTRAGDIIEELMIASNTALARELDARGQPSIRRVVKEPERWAKIAAYAAGFGVTLPPRPSAPALSLFADKMRREKADRFAEISLALVKLIGRGAYEAHQPGADETGHFGLAADAYTHGTAPNRRYVDLVLQRIVKKTRPYSLAELAAVAAHCTDQEAAAKKVERRVSKAVGATLLKHRVGETFQGVVTGAGPKGTYARIFAVPVEGKIVQGEKGLEVGDPVRVKLIDVRVEKGFIDFSTAA